MHLRVGLSFLKVRCCGQNTLKILMGIIHFQVCGSGFMNTSLGGGERGERGGEGGGGGWCGQPQAVLFSLFANRSWRSGSRSWCIFSVLRRRNRMFLSLPDPDPLARGTDPEPDTTIIKQKNKKKLDSYCFVTSLWLTKMSRICNTVFFSKSLFRGQIK